MINVSYNQQITYAPTLGSSTEQSEWRRSTAYIGGFASIFYNIFLAASAVKQIPYLARMQPLASSVAGVVGPVGQVAYSAGFCHRASDLTSEVLELDLPSTRKVIKVAGQGALVASWIVKKTKRFGFPLMGGVTVVGLALALTEPLIDLLINFRKKGWDSLNGSAPYKILYHLGLSLLEIYLFTAAFSLPIVVSASLGAISFGLSYI